MEKAGERGNVEDYTEDGSVDLKGKPVLRSQTGRWRACFFIVGYELFERMAYYGISTNLVVYFTKKLHEGTVTSSNNVTNWAGTVWLTPILGAYVADAFLGRYWTFLISSAIYLLGMTMLTLAVSVPALRPPPCGPETGPCAKASSLQKGVFFCALYTIAVGTGGTKPNISTMGADQFDKFEPKEKAQSLSFYNWWMFAIVFGTLFSNTLLVYIQDHVGWALGYGLPTIGLAVSIVVFLVGTRFYRHKLPLGSPMTRMAMVIVAAIRNWNKLLPNDPNDLYELRLEDYSQSRKFKIEHTNSLRFLDKAAIRDGSTSPWKLSPVSQVEETKQMLKMVPILAATFVPSALIAQGHTLFIKQGTTLDRHIGPNFQIPPASLGVFVTLSLLATLALYDRLFVPLARRYTRNPRGISLLTRLGTGFVLLIGVMVAACLTERRRLNIVHESGALGKNDIVPLSIFALVPQFALAGVAESFVETAKLEFFYDQAPEGMKSLGTSFFTSSVAIGSFLSSFLLKTVASVTERDGRNGWILDNLNISRLDYYFAFLACLGILNFFLFLFVAKLFVYNADVTESERDFVAVEDSTKKALVNDNAEVS